MEPVNNSPVETSKVGPGPGVDHVVESREGDQQADRDDTAGHCIADACSGWRKTGSQTRCDAGAEADDDGRGDGDEGGDRCQR
jgi:hypothetical protein